MSIGIDLKGTLQQLVTHRDSQSAELPQKGDKLGTLLQRYVDGMENVARAYYANPEPKSGLEQQEAVDTVADHQVVLKDILGRAYADSGASSNDDDLLAVRKMSAHLGIEQPGDVLRAMALVNDSQEIVLQELGNPSPISVGNETNVRVALPEAKTNPTGQVLRQREGGAKTKGG